MLPRKYTAASLRYRPGLKMIVQSRLNKESIEVFGAETVA